jgi:outer membrane murein-binding lipoprotein Lpp
LKKLYVFCLAAVLALSLLLTGCGNASKSNTNQPNTQTQDMNDSSHEMSKMDHSKMK